MNLLQNMDYTVVINIETSPVATLGASTSALANWNTLDASITAGDTVELYLSGVATAAGVAATAKGSLDNFFDPSQDYFNIATANTKTRD